MPELPEVETTRRGIAPHITGQQVSKVVVRQKNLRWPIPSQIARELPGERIDSVDRRGKYLLLNCRKATMLIHLGMSGSLRIVNPEIPHQKHDHFDFQFASSKILRYTDPRRFGCLLWHSGDISEHKLIQNLGPEPLTDEFSADYLFDASRGRTVPIKSFIMDSKLVVGVGNIYANEALFHAGIHPKRAAKKISHSRYVRLVECIKDVLGNAIAVGGTTLRDFTNSSGDPGYFKQSLYVYGRSDTPCKTCGRNLKEIRLGQRSTVYCGTCQR